MALVAARQAPALEAEFRAAATRIREEILARAWDTRLNAFTGTYGGSDLDASLLQMVRLRLLDIQDPRLRATVQAIRAGLSKDGWLFRYQIDDGFGQPTVAFIICTFWLVEALAALGLTDDARATMERIRSAFSPLGLLSEDCETADLRMWGNFPQAYSHVGLIHAAFAASPRWSDVL
jgi:GH15 family glucan-1,4-alpha-glucosidase